MEVLKPCIIFWEGLNSFIEVLKYSPSETLFSGSVHCTLIVSRSEYPKHKPFILKVFLVETTSVEMAFQKEAQAVRVLSQEDKRDNLKNGS